MTTVISVENLSKSYRLGQIGTGTFAHDLNVWWAKLRGKSNPMLRIGETDHRNRDGDQIWALRDINFTVDQGDVLGIIGRNGAGKSTLLKILSRVTAPTSGKVKIKGRVASLLEVGTGFHPDLTGRENIYLNGAILGMSRDEINRKFDEIVDFSGVEKFIDTPVKRYSSGMHVRLAFAVAAHLDPEILVVDEVLAVGDAKFQKKCLGKMSDVAKEGRTVLFVSHNMAAVQNLCSQAFLISTGQIIYSGMVPEVVDRYLLSDRQDNLFNPVRSKRKGDQQAVITNFQLHPIQPKTGMPTEFIFDISRSSSDGELFVELAVSIQTEQGIPLFQLYSRHMGQGFSISTGMTKIVTRIDNLPLAPGRYIVNLWLGSGSMPIDWLRDCFVLSVESGKLENQEFVQSAGYPVLIPSHWQKL